MMARRIIPGFLFLIAVQICIAQTTGKAGFDKFVFGSAPSDYKDIQLEIDEGNTKLYTAKASTPLSGVDFDAVNLTFNSNKLTSVAVKTRNGTGANFLNALKNSYGTPLKSNPAKGVYEWKDDKINLVYEKYSNSQDASASFYSVELYNAMKKKK
jgi:hypothetical protein